MNLIRLPIGIFADTLVCTLFSILFSILFSTLFSTLPNVLFEASVNAGEPAAQQPTAETTAEPTAQQLEFFEKEIRPLLAEHCYSCHSHQAKKVEAEFLLDSHQGLMNGGESGTVIEGIDPDSSLFIEAIRYDSLEMPPKYKLKQSQIDAFVKWVEMGTPWPKEENELAGQGVVSQFDLQKRKAEHWSWQPVTSGVAPSVKDSSWPQNGIDYYILAKAESQGLAMAPQADRRTLIRRLYFDLIGLPPTIAQINAYLEDASDNATEKVIDELLESKHFGERWGRHWLDLVRYAESRGHEFDNDSANAFQYRDYVIRAFNQDVPYDQFLTEHIAGDLIDQPRIHPQQKFNESVLGTGFWFLGEWVHSPVDIRNDETGRFDNEIDVMSKTFMATTIACARCHDHKFDAISARDYYALSGYLQSSSYRQVRFESQLKNAAVSRRLHQEMLSSQEKLSSLAAEALRPHLDDLAEKLSQQSGQLNQLPDYSDVRSRTVVDYESNAAAEFMADGYSFGQTARLPGTVLSNPALSNPALTKPTLSRSTLSKPSNEAPANGGFPVKAEPPIRFAEYGAAVRDPLWNGLSDVEGQAINQRNKLRTFPRAGRTVRTPTFSLESGTVSYLVRGSFHAIACVDSHRLLAGPLHGNTYRKVESKPDQSPRWVEHNLNRYVGHGLHMEFTTLGDQPCEVLMVVDGPAPKSTRPNRLLADVDTNVESASVPATTRVSILRELLSSIVDRVEKGAQAAAFSPDHAQLANWMLDQIEWSQPAQADYAAKLQRHLDQFEAARTKISSDIQLKSQVAMAMMDGNGVDDHVLIRGSSSRPGDVVERRFIEALDGDDQPEIESGSGRLALARQMTSLENPLTYRVITNRIWHHLLGRGIVPTVDDFGFLGQRPSHPELLDHLAVQFIDDGLSIKAAIKYVLMSKTYQMSSRAIESSIEKDPANLSWHHMPIRRLEGEVIRDAMLFVSGRLDATMFGNPIPIHLTDFMQGRGRPGKNGPLDGNGRRSIYIAVRRNFLSPMMLAFDTPIPFSSMGRRNVSNVPAQALILMNDPFVHSIAKSWAEKVLQEPELNQSERLKLMYESAFSRPPTEFELQHLLKYLSFQSENRNGSKEDLSLWSDVAHVLINTKEFLFIR